MPKRISIFWTSQAQDDLREIREFIARDAPITAVAFVRRLRKSIDRLRMFPESGQMVSEIGDRSIREILFGQYRIIYRVASHRVDILTVFHGAQLLDDFDG
jgi:toxin ParE1/3/4